MSIVLYDTTLRDGTQREGISLSVEDKLKITRLLDDLGVHFIEGGWPGSNPKDEEYFERVKHLDLKQTKVCAFSYTGRADVAVDEDPNLAKLLAAGTEYVTIVGKSWLLHVHEVLRVTPQRNLSMIEETVRFLRAGGRRVFYDAEHFFDGYKDDPEYALETLRAAARGGAETVILCDTNGGSLPWEIEEITRTVVASLPTPSQGPGVSVGIHTHNDGELGVANALAAVRGGATQVQGTINGYGERVGNCNLISTVANLKLKMNLDVVSKGALRRLTEVAHIVAELCNLPSDTHQPYVGISAFAHKGGIHADATVKCRQSYQHVDPESVGNQTRVLVSELAGKGNLLFKIDDFGLEQKLGKEQARHIVAEIKTLEARGFSFESAEASVAMLIRRQQPGYLPPFELVDFTTVVEHRRGRGLLAEATVKVRVDGDLMHTAAEGNGPVNALDRALRKALLPRYPSLASFELTDYKVRILDGHTGTASGVRVLIETRNTAAPRESQPVWTTVGCSSNIIEASWQALADAIEYGLTVVALVAQPVEIVAA
ncbi:MAG TPA: citramalate synthase [Chloroflexi bacterium]|nr:citramalate synthase [Chloroflexota bacterium]